MQSDHEFAPTQIAAAEFPTAFRGYDQDAVRHYLTRLASALSENGGDALAALARTTTLDRIEELEEENDTLRAEVRDLELELVQRSVDGPSDGRSTERSGRPGAGDEVDVEGDSEFDEHRAIELLGQETARVLESARSAAADIVKKAERQAKSIEKDARADLTDARRKARRLVAEKQAEAEALVAKVAAEAEESASALRTEADQHREMVLAESKKIMTDAEERAAADEKWAQDRAEQIVADAEALRQQLLSELVVERTKIRTDLEDMLSTRDRLVMALVVARSEMDDLSTRLDEASVKSPPSTPDIEVDDAETSAQVDELVAQLDEQLEPESAAPGKGRSKAKSSAGAGEDDGGTAEAGDDDGRSDGGSDEVIDLTDGDDSGKPSGGSSRTSSKGGSGATSGGGGQRSKRSTSRTRSRNKKNGRRRGSSSAKSSAATAVAEPEEVDAEAAAAGEMPVVDAADGADEIESGGTDEATDAEQETPGDEVEGDEVEADEVDDEAAGESVELSLIEGFNTIELSEAELGLARQAAQEDGSGDGQADGVLDQVLVTVASREAGTDMEGNRGDLLIDEEYRGRLPAAVAARDSALNRADDFHRSLRRALNDDQSEVLDRLRVGRGVVEVAELPKFSDQMERYLQPLRDGLAPVALAGAKAGGRREVSTGVLDNLVKQLAKYIVDKVRIPVIREVEHSADHDREKLFEPIRSVYRDFRNSGLLDLADDALYESFAIGLYGAIPAGSEVIWMLDPRHDPDPVCEINAGRTGLVKGEKFPSGHVRPLALPNCRCLVVAD